MTNVHTTPATLHVEASAQVSAPAAAVYRMIADYRAGHPRMLPPKFFRNFRVIHGGYGEGTMIEFDVIAFGQTVHLRATVSEPEPGSVLAETNLNDGSVTWFTVAPSGPSSARVTIATDRRLQRTGVLGWIESAMTRSYLHRLYAQQLAQLDEQVQLELREAASATSRTARRGAEERAATT